MATVLVVTFISVWTERPLFQLVLNFGLNSVELIFFCHSWRLWDLLDFTLIMSYMSCRHSLRISYFAESVIVNILPDQSDNFSKNTTTQDYKIPNKPQSMR